MLNRSLRRWVTLTVVAALAATGFSLVGALPASANNCWINASGLPECDVVVTDPGQPGTPGSGTTGPADFTPGPSSCVSTLEAGGPKEIPCSRGNEWWSNDRQCYWSLDDPQGAPPAGRDPSVGAWYTCAPVYIDPRGNYAFGQWLLAPPPGVAQYTPAQAAGMLARTFVLEPIPIGMAPEQKVHTDDPGGTAPYRRTWVGIPVWLWVDQPTEASWGPIFRDATYGGQYVSATASIQSLTWNSGDGQTVSCGAGTQFVVAEWANRAAEDSPSCGFRYQHTSDAGTFTVTATSVWEVQWQGGGQTGTIALPTVTSQTQVRVGELQSVNVIPSGTYN